MKLPREAYPSFCESAGEMLYEFGADAAAVRMFRKVLDFAYDSNVANTAAWILATTSDQTLRDGRAALALVAPIADRGRDDPTVLSTLAAANAEVGRFPEAVRAAESALAIVRSSQGDRSAESLLQRRLESYRAKQPWRQ